MHNHTKDKLIKKETFEKLCLSEKRSCRTFCQCIEFILLTGWEMIITWVSIWWRKPSRDWPHFSSFGLHLNQAGCLTVQCLIELLTKILAGNSWEFIINLKTYTNNFKQQHFMGMTCYKLHLQLSMHSLLLEFPWRALSIAPPFSTQVVAPPQFPFF